MKKLLHIFLLILIIQLSSSCDELFEYHPNQIRLNSSERNLTFKNLDRIYNQQAGDTLHILLMGDTQRYYDYAQRFVNKANSFKHIDFVIHQGDISDYGLTQEYKWVHDVMKNLKWPYLTVIGNHDLLANGSKVYQQMYGPLDYSFTYGHTKFVFVNTNGREYKFNGKVPDLDWLSKELMQHPDDVWQQAVVISHVAPFNLDFDKNLEMPYHQTLAKSGKAKLSLHGHDHRWISEEYYGDDILYHCTTSVNKEGFTYLKLWKDGYEMEKIEY